MRAHATAITFEGEERELTVPRSALSHRGFRAWVLSPEFPPRARASWIQGEVLVDMSPEALNGHNDVKTELTVSLGTLVRDEGLGRVFADRALLTHAGAGVSNEPDLMYVSYETIRAGRVRFVAAPTRPNVWMELEGTPDLVVEVVSDSSVRKDEVLLRAAYAAAGIPEYWIVDVRAESVRLDILVLRGEAYRRSARSRVFRRRFVLERCRDRVDQWEYRLRVV
jgi:Uma2 family endonuclease